MIKSSEILREAAKRLKNKSCPDYLRCLSDAYKHLRTNAFDYPAYLKAGDEFLTINYYILPSWREGNDVDQQITALCDAAKYLEDLKL